MLTGTSPTTRPISVKQEMLLKRKMPRCPTAKPKYRVEPRCHMYETFFPTLNAAMIPRLSKSAAQQSVKPKKRLVTAAASAPAQGRHTFRYRSISAKMDAKRPFTTEPAVFPRVQKLHDRVDELEQFIVEDIVSNYNIIDEENCEFEGLNDNQRDIVLEVLHKNQVVKRKATAGPRDIQGNEFHPQLVIEGDDNESIASFPMDEYDIQGEAPPEVELNLKYLGLDKYKMNDQPKEKRLVEKYDKLVNPRKQVQSTSKNTETAVEGLDNEFQTEMKKVTDGLKEWITHSLDISANLEDYMDFFEQHPDSRAQLPPNLLNQNILVAQKQNNTPNPFDIKKQEAPANPPKKDEKNKMDPQAFLNELEAVLSTWRPIYFDNKRGRKLNVVSDRTAPRHLITQLNDSLGLDLVPAKNDLDFTHVDSLQEDQMKRQKLFLLRKRMLYGRWFIEPEKWNQVHDIIFNKTLEEKRRERGPKSFIQRWCEETKKRRDQEEADMKAALEAEAKRYAQEQAEKAKAAKRKSTKRRPSFTAPPILNSDSTKPDAKPDDHPLLGQGAPIRSHSALPRPPPVHIQPIPTGQRNLLAVPSL